MRPTVSKSAKKTQYGFSLVELLVVMALFSTSMLVLTDIFVNVTRSQQRTLAWQQVQTEMRYVMEVLAQDIRSNTIDYTHADYTPAVSSPETTLALVKKETGDTVVFRTDNGVCTDGTPTCLVRQQNGGTVLPLTSGKIEIVDLKFYINSPVDPYLFNQPTQSYLSSIHPMVTIVMEAKSLGNSANDERTIHLQTAVSSRHYER